MDSKDFELKLKEIEEDIKMARRQYIERAALIIGGELYLEDFFFTASADKAIRILDGATPLLKARNITCCAILYRALIDLCMRTYAAFIAKDPQSLIQGYLEGKTPREFKDSNNRSMSDGYLKNQLEMRCPGLKAAYNLASGFSHFSREALQTITKVEGEYRIGLTIGIEHDDDMNDSIIDLGIAIIGATGLHMHLLDAVISSRKTTLNDS